jgi:uncharacterized protein YacL
MPLVSFWVVLLMMIISVVLGFLWYGPLFGKTWMRLSGIVMPDAKPSMKVMIKPIVLSLIGAIFMTYALSFVIAFHNTYFHTTGLVTSLSMTFLVWLGFFVPPYLNLSGWEAKPWKLFAINTGYWFVFLMIAGTLVTLFS